MELRSQEQLYSPLVALLLPALLIFSDALREATDRRGELIKKVLMTSRVLPAVVRYRNSLPQTAIVDLIPADGCFSDLLINLDVILLGRKW